METGMRANQAREREREGARRGRSKSCRGEETRRRGEGKIRRLCNRNESRPGLKRNG